jgi:hypothetical protein
METYPGFSEQYLMVASDGPPIPYDARCPNSKGPPGEQSLSNEWNDLYARFPTELECFEKLREGMLPDVLRCRNCRSELTNRERGSRLVTCAHCNKRQSITTDTPLHRMRKFRPFLTLICCIQKGMVFSAAEFGRIAGIATSTAANLIYKSTLPVCAELLRGLGVTCFNVCTTKFDKAIYRRSRHTPAELHPVTEQYDLLLAEAVDAQQRTPEGDNEMAVYNALSDDPTSTEMLMSITGLNINEVNAALTILELDHFSKPVGSNRFIRIKQKLVNSQASEPSKAQLADITNALNFIHSVFHGVSRRLLQLYLAWNWLHALAKAGQPIQILDICKNYGPVTAKDIKMFKSAIAVQVYCTAITSDT